MAADGGDQVRSTSRAVLTAEHPHLNQRGQLRFDGYLVEKSDDLGGVAAETGDVFLAMVAHATMAKQATELA
jgi:NTP pyrophosphatase (non-canonical NTP hydrolase)